MMTANKMPESHHKALRTNLQPYADRCPSGGMTSGYDVRVVDNMSSKRGRRRLPEKRFGSSEFLRGNILRLPPPPRRCSPSEGYFAKLIITSVSATMGDISGLECVRAPSRSRVRDADQAHAMRRLSRIPPSRFIRVGTRRDPEQWGGSRPIRLRQCSRRCSGRLARPRRHRRGQDLSGRHHCDRT